MTDSSNIQASLGLGCSAGLKMPIHAHFLSAGNFFTSKVDQTDVVFGVRPEFITRSVYARLQVPVCIGYDLYHPG